MDLIAKDILYHKSCYRDKTRAKTLDRLCENQEETGGSSWRGRLARRRPLWLRWQVIPAHQCATSGPKSGQKSPSSHRPCHYPWRRGTRGHSSWASCSTGADLPNVYDSYLIQTGIAAPPLREEHMRRHLEERFWDEVLVTAPRTRKEGALVYCDTSKGDLVGVLIKPSDRVQEGNE